MGLLWRLSELREENISTYLRGSIRELHELIHVKLLKQCFRNSKYYANITYFYYYPLVLFYCHYYYCTLYEVKHSVNPTLVSLMAASLNIRSPIYFLPSDKWYLAPLIIFILLLWCVNKEKACRIRVLNVAETKLWQAKQHIFSAFPTLYTYILSTSLNTIYFLCWISIYSF